MAETISEDNQFTIELKHLEGLEFRVRFDQKQMEEMLVGKPPSDSGGTGPNASRLLAAAAANCLSASLLYCIGKNDPPAGSLRTRATCHLNRNEKGRTRIQSIAITLEVNRELEQALRMKRCLDLYEDFSVVTASLRQGFPVDVRVVNRQGETLHQSPLPE